jgi:hypothetical protein
LKISPNADMEGATDAAPPWRLTSHAALAQLVEHIIRNDGVAGSNPASGTNKIK